MEHLEMKQKVAIMLAIVAAVLFAALNQTIISTALPVIMADLGGFELYSWVFTGFMLGSSVMGILAGRLSDLYGRKIFLLWGLVVFTIGTFLCGWADSMGALILYRSIQGIGGGMIMSTAFSAVGDLFSPRDRGRWQGVMGATFGLASFLGPTLGGVIVDSYAWQWIFWIFLPFGPLAILMIAWLFPKGDRKPNAVIDYRGAVYLTLTLLPLFIALSLAGVRFDWYSWVNISLWLMTFGAFWLFIRAEKRAIHPVLPLNMFKNDIYTISNGINFLMGAGMFGAILYLPFYLQGVMEFSATISGIVLVPMTLAMVFTTSFAGWLMTKLGTYKRLAIFGMATMFAGMLGLALLTPDTSLTMVIVYAVIVGAGLGFGFPVFTIASQNAVPHSDLGVATASTHLFKQLGGIAGVSMLGAIMGIQTARGLAGTMLASDAARADAPIWLEPLREPQLLSSPDQLNLLRASVPAEQIEQFESLLVVLRDTLDNALSWVFIAGGVLVFIGLLLTFWLREIELRTSNQPTTDAAANAIAPISADVMVDQPEPDDTQPKL